MRGILERQMRKCRGLVCCRGQGGVGTRVAGTMHACHAGIGKMRECASPVLGACGPLLDLICSVYHFPPRRACPYEEQVFPAVPSTEAPTLALAQPARVLVGTEPTQGSVISISKPGTGCLGLGSEYCWHQVLKSPLYSDFVYSI